MEKTNKAKYARYKTDMLFDMEWSQLELKLERMRLLQKERKLTA